MFVMAIAALACGLSPARAEVRLGKNVYVGGHDFSNRTYGPKRRGIVYLSKTPPKNSGCVWRKDGRGGRVQICHLQQKRRR
jgi:hypothetical protein